MRRFLLAVCFCLLFAAESFAQSITVSASAQTLLGTTQSISITVQLVDPNNTGMLKVNGTNIIPIMRASTVTPGTTATVGPIYGNDVIKDAFGNLNKTYYQVSVYTVNGGFVSSTPALSAPYAFTGSGTVDLSTATPLAPSFMSGPNGSVVVPGSLTVSGAATTCILNGMYVAGTSCYPTIAAAYAAIPSTGGKVYVPPNYSETLSSNLTLNKNYSSIFFDGPASLTMGSNQIIVPAGAISIGLESSIPYGAGTTSAALGVSFHYTGNGNAVQVGGSGTDMLGFRWKNINIDLNSAGNSAVGLYMTRTQLFDVDGFNVIGVGGNTQTQRGLVCDGTGNYCGTGTIRNYRIWQVQIGIQGTGTGTQVMNDTQIGVGICGAGGTSSMCIDIEVGGIGNTIIGPDAEGENVAYNLAGNAQGNFLVIRGESNTTDLVLGASTLNNYVVSLSLPDTITDSGTNNTVWMASSLKIDKSGNVTTGPSGSLTTYVIKSLQGNTITAYSDAGSTVKAQLNGTTGLVHGVQVVADLGSVCTNGELALSAGWQSTGSATATNVKGNGQTCEWTITTGTTTAANPTVTDTLTNALPNATTVCEMIITGGNRTAAAGDGFDQTTLSATAPVFTFQGTPTAGGKTYQVVRRCGP